MLQKISGNRTARIIAVICATLGLSLWLGETVGEPVLTWQNLTTLIAKRIGVSIYS
jgi:hypothetical protein